MEAMVSYFVETEADILMENRAGQIPFDYQAFYENTSWSFRVIKQEFFQAIEEGDVDRCRRIEKLVIDSKVTYPFPFVTIVDSPNNKKETPLVVASFAGHLNVVRYLVKHCKANVNKEAILNLSELKYRIPLKPLHAAVMSGNVDLVKFLVEECYVDINCKSGIPEPYPYGRVFSSMFKPPRNHYSLLQSDNTPLHYAIYAEFNPLMVTCLVQNGADPFILNGSRKFPWELWYLEIGEKEALRRLIKLGLDVNRQDESTLETLAHHHIDSLEIIQFLMDEGADFTLKDRFGQTPFVLALKHGKINTTGKAIFEHQYNSLSLKDKIAHLELMGAFSIHRNCILTISFEQISNCRMYWERVVQLRLCSQPDEFPKKNDREEWPYCVRMAFQGIPDIEICVGNDRYELRHQAALAIFRYLGQNSIEFEEIVKTLALDYYHASQDHRFLNLYMMIIECRQSVGSCLKYKTMKSYGKLVQILSNLSLKRNSSPDVTFCFSNHIAVFYALLDHFEHLVPIEGNRLCADLLPSVIQLTRLFIDMKKSEEEEFQIKRCLSEFIKVQQSNAGLGGYHLLRKAFEISRHPGESRVPWIIPVICLLIRLGADPNSMMNHEGDTALHVLARRNYQVWDSPLVVAFLESGASLYKMNKDKETVLDLLYEASPKKGSIFVHPLPQYFPTLKFLSARIICKEIPGYDSIAILPKEIVNFIKRQSD